MTLAFGKGLALGFALIRPVGDRRGLSPRGRLRIARVSGAAMLLFAAVLAREILH